MYRAPMNRPTQWSFSLILPLALLGSCATGTGRTVETTLANALVSTEQENEIGVQVKAELEQKQGVRYLNDPAVVDYVRGVAALMIAQGKKARPDVQWQVNVIDDPKTVNAFATPGGFLYVYSGLLAAAKNEAELAGVMGHETGHVVARHAARNLVTAYGLEAAVALAGGQNPGLLRQLATSIAANGLFLAHSRADETEADEIGVRFLSAAGYDPKGIITFFGTLAAQQGQTPGIMKYFSTHPAPEDRITHLQQYIAQNNLGGSAVNEAQFRAIKSRIAALPASSAPSSGGAPPPPPSAPPAPPASSAPPPPPPR
jgi:predicted Zn-dependent protease